MYGMPGLNGPSKFFKLLDKIPRMTLILVITIGLLFALASAAPQQLPVVMYKLCLVTLGAFLGYWIDRLIFPYARPHTAIGSAEPLAFGLATLRRALIVFACILGLTLGL